MVSPVLLFREFRVLYRASHGWLGNDSNLIFPRDTVFGLINEQWYIVELVPGYSSATVLESHGFLQKRHPLFKKQDKFKLKHII